MAVPLPRRGPHGRRDDRHLPGLAMRGVLAIAALAARCSLRRAIPAALGRRRPVREVSIPGRRSRPACSRCSSATPSSGETATRTNHTVTADDDSFDSGFLSPGSTFTLAFTKAGDTPTTARSTSSCAATIVVVPVALQGPPQPVVAGGRGRAAGPGAGRDDAGRRRAARRRRHGVESAVTPAADGSFTVTLRANGRRRSAPGHAAADELAGPRPGRPAREGTTPQRDPEGEREPVAGGGTGRAPALRP